MMITEKQGKSLSNSDKAQTYIWGENTHAHAHGHLWRENIQIIYSSQKMAQQV